MYKKIAICSLFIATTLACAQETPNKKYYAKAELGYGFFVNHVQTDYDYISSKKPKPAPFYGIGGGYKITENLRVGGTVATFNAFKQRANVANATMFAAFLNQPIPIEIPATERYKLSTGMVMADAQYDFKNFNNFTPYVSMQLGYANNKASSYRVTNNITPGIYYTAEDEHTHNIAYGVGFGVSYKLKHNMIVGVGYNFLDLGKFKNHKLDYYNNNTKIPSQGVYTTLKSKLRAHNIAFTLTHEF